MAGHSASGFGDLSASTNGSDATKRPGTPQITPSELSRPANLQRIAQRKAQIKTYPIRKKLEKLGVYSSCKASIEVHKGNIVSFFFSETFQVLTFIRCIKQ